MCNHTKVNLTVMDGTGWVCPNCFRTIAIEPGIIHRHYQLLDDRLTIRESDNGCGHMVDLNERLTLEVLGVMSFEVLEQLFEHGEFIWSSIGENNLDTLRLQVKSRKGLRN